MQKEELSQLWNEIEEIIYSPTKKDGQILISRLNYKVNLIKSEITDPYLFNKLKEVIIYAKEASGRVNNKEHWKLCAEQSWYTFESGMKFST